MGRRKIEIKAIKDDRNRSVTFLKRKGGLFKKAHELSVLCSVDVAVIIFGHNKKLYEFSSGDINETIGRYQYYGGPHEHKGPEDFMGKGEADEEEDEATPPPGPPPPHPPQHQYTHPPPSHSQVQQVYQQEQNRRQSMPPTFSQPPPPQPQQPDHHSRQASVVPSPPQPEQHHFQSPPIPQPKPLPHAAKSHSVFTPIDDSRSLLAQHWGNTSNAEPIKTEGMIPTADMGPRSQSIDVAAMHRAQHNGASPHPPVPTSLPHPPQRTSSTSSVPNIGPPSRTNSMPDAKRPRLKVQIPDEHSEAENTGSPKDTSTSTGPIPPKAGGEASQGSGVVLPPPSPSASALLSAGASGPPNPFARPAPPTNNSNNSTNNSYGRQNDMETPISALPSRFVADGLLPSPSSFYPEWGFGRDSSNMLPSPLTFQTPVVQSGPSFRDEDPERKRKTSEGSDGGASKRMKS
ncbi:hypothetical protein K490DRAFT_40213 [Saccharata proteae CBS 121410]|uniref:MADS-box domain-containing protein n=1 Tax=Saccharata proteae CBS 121410 TaxID=1314787 RepID=A0A9P4LXG1_9PEZI|nr:hypothetical protein K490DRAFT_40213 [Saccharata proteae CBS 121410]